MQNLQKNTHLQHYDTIRALLFDLSISCTSNQWKNINVNLIHFLQQYYVPTKQICYFGRGWKSWTAMHIFTFWAKIMNIMLIFKQFEAILTIFQFLRGAFVKKMFWVSWCIRNAPYMITTQKRILEYTIFIDFEPMGANKATANRAYHPWVFTFWWESNRNHMCNVL